MVKRKDENKENGKVVNYFDDVTGLLDNIWAEISSFQNQEWKLPKNRKPLTELIGKIETDKLYEITDTKEQNIHLRTLLIEPLKDNDYDKRLKAIKWIVVRWGVIPRGKKDYPIWSQQLESYQPNVVKNFILHYGTERISSWSKVLAFADSSKYAIFDSRVAISLNTIFDKAGYKHRFYMPTSRSDDTNVLFKNVKAYVGKKFKGQRPVYFDYFDYLKLLESLVVKYPTTNILDLEMRLFANSERLAIEYAQKYNIPYDISPKK